MQYETQQPRRVRSSSRVCHNSQSVYSQAVEVDEAKDCGQRAEAGGVGLDVTSAPDIECHDPVASRRREVEKDWGTTRLKRVNYLRMRPFDPPFENNRVPSGINV
jgi:hypothetical protein